MSEPIEKVEVPAILNPIECLDLLTTYINNDQWQWPDDFGEAVARLNAACARQLNRRPPPEAPDPDDGSEAAIVEYA
jgi:hypothetical protein